MLSERYTHEQDRYNRRDRDARIRGAAPREMNLQNWGSARSDYGEHAYGGRLDERGIEHNRGPHGRHSEMWTETQVRDVMTDDVICVQPEDPAEYAARLMRDCDCGAIPVVDRDRRMIGMITDRDIAVRLVARGANIRDARVDDCMTDEAFACEETSSIDDCMHQMSRHQVRRMPIVDRRGRVVGIVSQSDLARHAEAHRGTGERRAVADVLCAVSEPSPQPYR